MPEFKETGEFMVLYGGGDGGGYIFLNGRIIRIPPYDPETVVGRAQAVLNAVNAMSQAATVNRELSGELNTAAIKLAKEAIGQITKGISQGAQAQTA